MKERKRLEKFNPATAVYTFHSMEKRSVFENMKCWFSNKIHKTNNNNNNNNDFLFAMILIKNEKQLAKSFPVVYLKIMFVEYKYSDQCV